MLAWWVLGLAGRSAFAASVGHTGVVDTATDPPTHTGAPPAEHTAAPAHDSVPDVACTDCGGVAAEVGETGGSACEEGCDTSGGAPALWLAACAALWFRRR